LLSTKSLGYCPQNVCKLPNPKEYDDMGELKKQSEEVVEQLTSLLK